MFPLAPSGQLLPEGAADQWKRSDSNDWTSVGCSEVVPDSKQRDLAR
jgi:hypothetical protein